MVLKSGGFKNDGFKVEMLTDLDLVMTMLVKPIILVTFTGYKPEYQKGAASVTNNKKFIHVEKYSHYSHSQLQL